MGTDTKGIVKLCRKIANPFDVAKVVSGTIKSLIQEHPKVLAEQEKGGLAIVRLNHESEKVGGKKLFVNPTFYLSGFSESFTIVFAIDGEHRNLSVHFDCHHDYEQLFKGRRIILSLGMWGSSIDIMGRILEDITKVLGYTSYLIPNDCADDALESATIFVNNESKNQVTATKDHK